VTIANGCMSNREFHDCVMNEEEFPGRIDGFCYACHDGDETQRELEAQWMAESSMG
jgi:hypothetical protein